MSDWTRYFRVCALLCCGFAAAEPKPMWRMETYVYKHAAGCDIKLDVYSAVKHPRSRGVVFTIHGGGLILGSRYPIPLDLFEPLLNKGMAVVSVDYRLAPESKLPELLNDIQDAYAWVRKNGPRLFDADPDRIAVQGGSAGGYLTLMMGLCVTPRPRALVSYFGYGDIAGDWLSKPDAHYNLQSAVPRAEAMRAVGRAALTGYPQVNQRFRFYLHCRQQGIWPTEVSGIDVHQHPEEFQAWCPAQHVTKDYPPTLLAHGTADTDVPYAQSVLMNQRLQEAGVEHQFITLKDAEHGFNRAKPEDYAAL